MSLKKQKLSSSNLIILAAVLLATYLILILAVTNLGQTRLIESQQRELNLKVQSYATMLEYFFYVTDDEIANLSRSKSMQTYFANLASGMSMQYGLGASLYKLDRDLTEMVKHTDVHGTPVYQRINLLGFDGKVIAGSDDKKEVRVNSHDYLATDDRDFMLRTVHQDDGMHIEMVKKVYYSGKAVAYLIVDINKEVIIKQLTTQEHEGSRSRIELVEGSKGIFVWDSLLTTAESHSEKLLTNKIYFETPIANTPFQLKSWFEPLNEKDIITSGWFIAGISFLAVPVFFGLIYTFRINNTNIILRTKVYESNKKKKILFQQNKRLVKEIEKRKESEQKLAYQATHDALTGLPNRKYGYEQLEDLLYRAKVRNTQFLVMFIDLDNFKHINDSLGHLAGDFILKQSSLRLQSAIREKDILVRLGGDEFLLVIEDADVDKATELAATLLALFEKPFIWSGREFFMSSSIGISVYPEDGKNIQQLLATADTAMYRVKQDGRNAYHFYHEAMNTDLQRKLDLDGRLRQAMGKGELAIYYQPIIDLQTHTIVAAEALLRWQDKKYGTVSPEEFIPLAEQNGFIHKLGDFVIKQACHQAAQWQAIQPLQIAVNFSSVQFRYCEQICHQIERALAISGLPADKLEIEVTESLLFDHSKAVVALLEKLQSLGTQLTIDDFGTGYSALSYLQKFPFHRLKIDKSFLQNLDTNAANRELVNAIVAMAQALKLTVVAEGIESEWQAEHLQKMGCDFGQGYYFSRPVPAEEFEQLLLTMNTAGSVSVIDQA